MAFVRAGWRCVASKTLLFLIFVCYIASCKKKQDDPYYVRPANLAPPIYQQLAARGNFKSLLTCIDRAGYKAILSAAGSWTLFAPNDEAFGRFLTENSLPSADKLDSTLARKIVTYALLYNGFTRDKISQILTNGNVSGGGTINLSSAYKRKTPYYEFVTTNSLGRKIVGSSPPSAIVADNNNKYLPYFTSEFFSASSLQTSDYSDFFPNATFGGFSVLDAKVIEADIVAENGIIHITDKVVLPLYNFDQYLASKPEYSEFKKLLDRLVSYVYNSDVTTRYRILSGSGDSVFTKLYNASLAFSPNRESKGSDLSTTYSGYTLTVPKNEALIAYEKTLLFDYKNFDAAPPAVLLDLLNAHFWTSANWPSKFYGWVNAQDEQPTFQLADLQDRKVVSNGIFYGMNAVQESNVFRTVYANAYLDSKYSLLTRLFNIGDKFSLINPGNSFTLFLSSDASFRKEGFDFNELRGDFAYTTPGGIVTYGAGPKDQLLRIVSQSIIPSLKGDLSQILTGQSGVVETNNGEYLKYTGKKLQASGNVETGTFLNIDSVKQTKNGKVAYLNGVLTFTRNEAGFAVQKLAVNYPENFDSFYQLLVNSPLWVSGTLEIKGILAGNSYTVFVPTNAAIAKAGSDGILPLTPDGAIDFKPSKAPQQDSVRRFLQYHIINKASIATDGFKTGAYPTLLTNGAGSPALLSILVNTQDQMQIQDATGKIVNVLINRSNNLSNRTVIHSIDDYLGAGIP